jgi:DNA topoisomerase I
MKKSLVIVESPAKIKTLQKFLGSDFVFASSIGHIRDLPVKEFGIDIEEDFTPKYVTMDDKANVISELKKLAKQCDTVYLCPDPDREGEAIAWHIREILPEKTNTKRVSFNSITKEAVLKAIENPRELDLALVDAQQARRLLDRIVGYKISPILNRRIQRGRGEGVSAGRVQSVALKLVVDREKEIEAFDPVEYWNLGAILKTESDEKNFKSNLYSVDGKKVEKEAVEGKDLYLINNKDSADQVIEKMKQGEYSVEKVVKKEKRRHPVPPFITSTIQQEASRHYGFSSARTMSVAQKLYEGIDMGNEGAEGLITYMRTDSTRIAPEAISEVRSYIQEKYGPDFLPESPKFYSTKKSAQDAHEAIRPTNLQHPPEMIEKYLTKEQFLLYKLIWRRFVASQMKPAIYDTVSADITNNHGILLRATGSVIKFEGFLAVYEEKVDDDKASEDSKILPIINEGDILGLIDLLSDQAFTRPPPRFSEASLVKELEKSGIGRPSTYATIMNKIQSRDYTVKESGRLKPTELGRVIAALLEANFTQIMDVSFTANMEDALEQIAEKKKDWKELLREFWKDFKPTLDTAEKEAFVPRVDTDIDCPDCKEGKLQKIWFKNKYFYGCTRYPECEFSSPIEQLTFDKNEYAEAFDWDQKCPECQEEMKIRHGRFGAFLGCSKYPECRGIVNIPKKGELYIPESDMPKCPAIDCPGRIQARRSRFGKTFYSCSTYPDCNVIVNNLDDLTEKYPNHPRTPYEKKTRGKKKAAAKGKGKGKTKTKEKKEKKPRNMPKVKVSDILAEVVGNEELTRGGVTKEIWVYIKANNLQDPNDKRMIVPDEKLTKIFGSSESVSMFKMAGLINKHIN